MEPDIGRALSHSRDVKALTTAYMLAQTGGRLEEFERCQTQLQEYVNTGVLRVLTRDGHDVAEGRVRVLIRAVGPVQKVM